MKVLVALLVAVGIAWPNYVLYATHRVERQLAHKHATVFGQGAPFDCRRLFFGDESVEGLVDDTDYACTARKANGDKCGVGECAGLVVDVEDGRIKKYTTYGGP